MIIKHQDITHILSEQQVVVPRSEEHMISVVQHHSVEVDESIEIPEPVTPPPDPYSTQDMSPQLFEQGKLKDRRELRDPKDRRLEFRRESDLYAISTAEKEGERIKQQARHEGFEQGLNEASEELARLKKTMDEFVSARQDVFEQATSEISTIALEVAKKLLKSELEARPEAVAEFVKQAIASVGKRQKFVTVRLHPSDLPIVDKAFQEKSPVSDAVDLTLLEDVSVDPGSCIIETQAGQVDKRFSTQLEVLERLMQKEGLM